MKGKKIVEVGLAAIIALSGVASAAAPAFAAPNVIYPNVQSYTKDSDTFTLPKKSRLLVVSNEKTLNNEVLLRDLKRASSQLLDRGVLSEAPQIVFGTLENAADNDIIVKMGTNPDLTGKNDAYAVDIKNNIVFYINLGGISMKNEAKSILQPKNDVVFKALFSRGKPRITQAMLEAILKMKIDKLELDKSTDLLNENADDKNGRLDLRAIINGNTECDIEVQLVSNDNIAERFVYYWAKMYAANLKIGDKYSDLRKTISIIILDDDFKLTKNLEKPQTTWRIRESEATHLVLTDYFEIIIIEIPKVVKAYKKTPNDEVLQWMLFLDNPEKEEVTRIMEENKDIKEAKEELERISQDDILRRKALNRTLEIADRLQMKKELKEAKEALKKEKNIGLQEGKTEKAHEVVIKLKEMNLPIEQIAKAVELKEEEVKAILNEKK